MSRSAHQQSRQQQKLQQQQLLAQQQQIADSEAAAAAAEIFDLFCGATTMRHILGFHRTMCDLVGLRPGPLNEFYPKLKAKVRSWKAQALWKKFDARAAHRVYSKGNACTGVRVLVIGAGPCGLRTAIEAQLLGAKVVVIEKRDRISRNNVLHLWPFVITDLRNLGAKKFYGKFCAGSIDHISIRQLQCILLKVALLLGVEIHEGVSFERTIEPSDDCGWRAEVTPSDHAVSHYEFDVLIGADGKRNTLEGFKRKEFRGKLAIAITANFINKKTEAEAKAEEISGVAFIFNQSFFKDLYRTTGIDLENIVYYKDETHYFVMTAKKHSLIDKGVIMQDFADPAELLAQQNVNKDKLLEYAREAAEFSTKYQMPNLEFAVNHYGKPDVAMFDFTSMFAAETSCRVIVRKGYRLLQCLVGDSLLEPFWPTGSGCARGFLSSMDAAYAIKLWANPQNSVLAVLAQRESIYRLLNQTTPENLQRDIGSYTVDPATRYPNLNRSSVNVWQVKHLVDSDDKAILEQTFMDANALQVTQIDTPVRRKRRSGDSLPLSSVLLRWICAQLHAYDFSKSLKEVSDVLTNGKVLCALINRYRPDLVDFNDVKDLSPIESNELAFKIIEKELHIPRVMSGKESVQLSNIESKVWLTYLEEICEVFRGEIPHVKHPKMNLTELREKYHLNSGAKNAQPDFSKLLQISTKQNKNNRTAMQDIVDLPPQTIQKRSVLDEEKLKKRLTAGAVGTPSAPGPASSETPRRAKKRRNADKANNIDRERGDIPSAIPRNQADEQFSDRIKSMEQRITSRHPTSGNEKKPKDLMRAIGKIDSNDWNIKQIEKKIEQSKKTEVHGPKGREKVPKWSKEQFQARQNKMAKPLRQDSKEEEKFKEIDQTLKNLDKQLKEGHNLDVGERGRNKVASIAGQFVKKTDDTSEEKNIPTVVSKPSTKVALAFKKQAASENCHFCKQTVYLMEKATAEGLVFHRSCLKCHHCHTNLRLGNYAFDRDDPNGRFYCTQHYRLPAKAIRPVVRKPGQRKSSQNQQQHHNQQQAPSSTNKTETDAAVADTVASASTTLDPNTPLKIKNPAENLVQQDMLDRGQTPERIEFENSIAMSDGEPSEEHIIDEHEWSGRNFLPESNNDSESDLSSSDESDTESDSDLYEEANESPLGAQTLQLATDWIGKQHYSDSDESDFYDSSDGLVDIKEDDSEGEDIKKARELRREEVRLLPLPPNLPTDTETEVQTDTESSSVNLVELNSATEISTDSEFENDEIIREAPMIFIDDTHLRKPTKVQVKSMIVSPSRNDKFQTSNKIVVGAGSYLQKYQQQPQQLPQPQFKPLIQVDPTLLISNRSALQNPRQGDYLLNKTASTEGIASKKSLELKKRYLLGEPDSGNKIQKSGSTSVLDSRIRTFQSNISECQKLLNPGNEISPSMKTFLDRTKLGENLQQNITNPNDKNNDLMRSATSNLLNDLKIQITIQKTSSQASTDNEKENNFVNNKNELNKGKEFTENFNAKLLENLNKISTSVTTNVATTPTPTTPSHIIETIDLISPEKNKIHTIDLTKDDLLSNKDLENMQNKQNSENNKVIDLTLDSPVKNEQTILDDSKPDVSKDVRESIPDILDHIEKESSNEKVDKRNKPCQEEESEHLLSHSGDEEKKDDSPEKNEEQSEAENETLQIKVPTIPWNSRKNDHLSTTTTTTSNSSSCSSNSSSLEDIQHYILESTSPDTQTPGSNNKHNVPRVEIHDTTGTLMQIDSLMIVDGKYVGDLEDLKYMEIPEGIIVPETPAIKTSELEDDNEIDIEPVTATPEPAECTVIEAEEQVPPLPDQGPPLPETQPPKMKPSNLKFDSKNENKIESLKNLPLILEQTVEHTKAIKPVTLELNFLKQATTPETPTTPKACIQTPSTPLTDNDKTPTMEHKSKGSDSETEPTGTGQVLTETELSDWTADDCISENFIEMDFMADSTRNTIKRSKKSKKKLLNQATNISTSKQLINQMSISAPVAEFEGILKAIDIDDIEFMDTGSDGSCAEAYSATNTALLQNRGYVEFIETTPNQTPTHKVENNTNVSVPSTAAGQQEANTLKSKAMLTKRDEKRGVDYIEQGAYIMNHENEGSISSPDLLKTPVNENPCDKMSSSILKTLSLTDSSTINDLDDDSLYVGTSNSQTLPSTNNKVTHTATTATEESEALTLVTSPSSSKNILDDMRLFKNLHKSSTNGTGTGTGGESSTPPSSSDLNPKTSQSTGSSSNHKHNTTTGTSGSTSASISASASASHSGSASASNTNISLSGKSRPSSKDSDDKIYSQRIPSSDDFSYEEYVRVLQQKITQISTGRDSMDARKHKRKSSKGETPIVVTTSNGPTVIETISNNSANSTTLLPSNTISQSKVSSANSTVSLQPATKKLPEVPTLTRKLEEITKERTKQKDIIHDLVMDKLQSKKQLNAEKRLHRSRQRSMISGYTSGSSLSPTPKVPATSTSIDNNCSNQAHYHVSTANLSPASIPSSPIAKPLDASKNSQNFESTREKESNPLQKSSTYVSPYGLRATCSPKRYEVYKQRPFSENIDPEQLSAFEKYKLSKTPSFSYAIAKVIPQNDEEQHPKSPINRKIVNSSADMQVLNKNPLRFDTHTSSGSYKNTEQSITASTENLRTEARARARLKSNSELGLSPDEKMQLLRQRLNYDQPANHPRSSSEYLSSPLKQLSKNHLHYEARERKMNTSKSVNDLVFIENQQRLQHQDSSKLNNEHKLNNYPAKSTTALADLGSEPSLTEPSKSAHLPNKKSKRNKDPERRKSLIQSLSSFFHKTSTSTSSSSSNHQKDINNHSAQPEHNGIHASNMASSITSSVDGMLSRLRISPKSKEKSKSCFDLRRGFGFGDKIIGSSSTTNANQDMLPHERSTSHESISPKSLCNKLLNNSQSTKSNLHINQNDKTPNNGHPTPQSQSQQQKSHDIRYNKKSVSPTSKKTATTIHTATTAAIATTTATAKTPIGAATANFSSSSPQLYNHNNRSNINLYINTKAASVDKDEQIPPPIPPLPLNYQRSDDESYTNETREQKRQRAITKSVRQAELKRLRIAQEIQREQEEIEVQLKELEARGVLIEKALRGEAPNLDSTECTANDEKLLKELLEIWRNITQLKKRDEELSIRQQELQLEHRHAQLKEELNLRLSCNKLDKSSADVAAEGAILNEMLEIVAKRAALRPTGSNCDLAKNDDLSPTTSTASTGISSLAAAPATTASNSKLPTPTERITLNPRIGQSRDNNESNI